MEDAIRTFRSLPLIEKLLSPKRADLYSRLCDERPKHWFRPPTIVTRASGLEVVLYPDLIETMIGLDMEKTVAEVSRDDLTDEQVETLVNYIHGVSPRHDSSNEDLHAALGHIKVHLDLCESLQKCRVNQSFLDQNAYYQLGRELSDIEIVQKVWASHSKGRISQFSSQEIGDAIGVGTVGRLFLLRLIAAGNCPLADSVHQYAKRCSKAIIPLSPNCDCSTSVPDGYVFIEVGSDDEPDDEDNHLLPTPVGARTRFLIYGPSLWLAWPYIRRMHLIDCDEVRTRRITLPADFPRRLFALLIYAMLNVITPQQAVYCFTPKLHAYLVEHAGLYDFVDAHGKPAAEFESLMFHVKNYDWNANKAIFLAAREKARKEEDRATSSSSTEQQATSSTEK
jgi:hypothetical protein